MEIEKVTRKMPTFQNHEEAKQWFRNHFHENFLIRCSDAFYGKKMYVYHIVKNKTLYHNYMRSFAEPKRPTIKNMDTFECYSTVEISDNGEVHIYI